MIRRASEPRQFFSDNGEYFALTAGRNLFLFEVENGFGNLLWMYNSSYYMTRASVNDNGSIIASDNYRHLYLFLNVEKGLNLTNNTGTQEKVRPHELSYDQRKGFENLRKKANDLNEELDELASYLSGRVGAGN